MSKPTGVVSIRGREYKTVALRVSEFREKYPTWRLTSEILQRDTDCVVIRAVVQDDQGVVVADGLAEEYRKASDINRTSALENCETSALGRALAKLGFGGSEFASADELANAVSGKPQAPLLDRTAILKAVNSISDAAANDRDLGVLEHWQACVDVGEDFASAVWHCLITPVRDAVRRVQSERKSAA